MTGGPEPEFVPTLTGDGDNDVRGTAPSAASPAPAPDTSGGDRAALAPDGANRAAAAEEPPPFPGEAPRATGAQPTVAEKLADRAGTNDTEPLGDPNAPQGTGTEQDMRMPENRLAPAGKIRFAQADSRHEPEHGE